MRLCNTSTLFVLVMKAVMNDGGGVVKLRCSLLFEGLFQGALDCGAPLYLRKTEEALDAFTGRRIGFQVA